MNYIYDIVLNFNKEYFEFFQWKKGDKIINIKKIPVFKVSDEEIRNFKYNNIIVCKEFVDKICELTLFYNRNDLNYKYLCLVSNGTESIGLMFNKNGKLLKRSSMIFEEEEEVNEEVINEKEVIINYIENEFKEIEFISRIDKERRDYLFKFINNLDIDVDSCIFKYIYYDYFEKEEDDVSRIKELLLNELKSDNGNKTKLYILINLLKKIKN